MTLRFAYLAVLRMLGWLALLARSDVAKDAEILVLRHQIAVLQRHANTPRLSWAGRAIISALARLLPHRYRSQLRLIVSPRTLLRWHAAIVKRRWCYPHRRPGRPPVPRTIGDLTLEMARDNPAWGYRRIHGELTGLGYKVAPSTIWKILHDAGINPAPNRHGQTWHAFVAAQAHTILAADFFHIDTVFLRRLYVSNQVPSGFAQGTGTTMADLFVGDFRQLLIGQRLDLQIQTLTERYAELGQIGIVATWRGDIQLARPRAFSVFRYLKGV